MSVSPANRPSAVYLAACAAVAVATVARAALDPWLGDDLPFVTFFVAVIVSTWLGGLRPGLLAAGLGLTTAAYLFVPPRHAVWGTATPQLLSLGLYVMVCGAITAFGEGMWRGRRALEQRERAAREQAEMLRTTFASIGDAVITTDASGLVTYLNPVAEQLTGYAVAEARGRRLTEIFQIVNQQTRESVENPVERVLALGQVVGLANHTVLIAKDGVERPIDDSGAPIRDDEGHIVGVVLVFRDVTDRKRAEDQLRERSAMLQAISEGTTDLIYAKDSSSRFLFANHSTLEVMGVTAAEAIGAEHDTLFQDHAEHEAIRAVDRRIMTTGVSEAVEEQFTGPHGFRTYLSSKSPLRDGHGNIVGLIGVSRDITERRRAEEQLRQSETRFRLLADALPQIVYVTEPDGRVTFINQQWIEYTGQADAQQADLGPLVHPDDLPPLMAAWQRAASTGTPLAAEFRLRRVRDGAYRWFLTRSVPVVDDDGRIARWHGTSTDIHEQKLTEARTRAGETRQAFLVALADTLRPVSDPIEVQAVASRMLGEALAAHRVAYFEVAGDSYRVTRDYTHGVPSLSGEYPTASFGPRLFELYQGGETAIEHDVLVTPTLSPSERDVFTDLGIRAYVGVPLVKNGVFVAGLAVHHTIARAWSAEDIALIQETAERTWAAVERGRVEAALVASEARFRAVFETMDEGFCVAEMMFDDAGRAIDYRILEMNPAFERQTGLHGVLGRTVREFAPTLEEFWFDTCGRVATTGASVRFVQQAPALQARWFEVYAFRLGGDGSRKVAMLFADITARTLADQAASLRSEQVRRLAEVLPRVSATTDIRSIMGVVTAEARRLIDSHQSTATLVSGDGWANAMVVTSLSEKYAARRYFDRQPTDDRIDTLVCRTNMSMRLTQAELEAHQALRAFGPHRAEHPPLNGWLAVPLIGRDGRNMGVLQLSDKVDGAFTADDEAVLMQVAQMAAVAIDNARLVDELQVADRRKDEFLSVLAHELRNPLAPIRNGLHLMKVAPDDALTVARAREIMDRQVTQMVRLIDDLMDLTRISRGKLLVLKARVALADVLRIAVETSRPLIEQAGHTLTVAVPDDVLMVEADETRLAQVFANLLNNAAKYTPPGGRVGLEVQHAGDEVTVTVEDNGVGIPPAMLGQVFDMFTQVDRSLEQSQGGLGIGLNIARRLVEMHGGRITAESAGEGHGTRFAVHLPLAAPGEGSAPGADGVEDAPQGPQRRVLVVDDNADAAASLSLMLEMMGHDTRIAHDGRDAVMAADEFRPDLILMDIGMPTLNGYDACRQIRERPWGRDVIIVACTGWGQDEDRQRSTQAGFDMHMVKPPSPAAVERLVAGLHGRPREDCGRFQAENGDSGNSR